MSNPANILSYQVGANWQYIDLPLKHSYTFLFCSNNANEEQVRELVQKFESVIGYSANEGEDDLPKIALYMNYTILRPVPITFLCDTALESFHSLLRLLGLDTDKNYAILKIN